MNKVETKRVFIAVELSAGLKSDLKEAEIKAEGFVGGRWIDSQKLHLTLKFLGNCEPKSIDLIYRELDDIAASHRAFSLKTTVFGCFPSSKKARILWLGLNGNGQIYQLQQAIEGSIVKLGFTPEDKKFHPHITVVRLRNVKAVKLAELNQMIRIDRQVEVDHIAILESRLTSRGADYILLKKFKLLA